MAKIDPKKKIQKRRTEEEMRCALMDYDTGHTQRSTPSQDDDTGIILKDCIEELLEARKTLEQIRGFVSEWYPKMTAR
jgi:hypothetical protein